MEGLFSGWRIHFYFITRIPITGDQSAINKKYQEYKDARSDAIKQTKIRNAIFIAGGTLTALGIFVTIAIKKKADPDMAIIITPNRLAVSYNF